MSRVGIGIIGAGNISTQYLENLTKFADVEVRFVADVLLDRAAAQAAEYGVASSGTVEELLARDDISIVINLTIPAAHAEVDQQIIDAGKHVWSEKPIATDHASAAAVLASAKAKGLRLDMSRGKNGSNDANAEYLGHIRAIFDKEDVHFQTAELGKVDLGGGGTIAYILALYGMNVIDSGVAVLNMHAPWEATSKADVYEAKRGYVAFLEHASL